jgi:hypothetical protein
MANEKNEMFIGRPDRIDVQHEMHARALGRPTQAGVAENLGGARSNDFVTMETTPIQVHDASLSWGAGQSVATQGRGDTKSLPEAAAAGISAKVVRATEPTTFGQALIPVKNHNAALNGVDQVARATEIRGER